MSLKIRHIQSVTAIKIIFAIFLSLLSLYLFYSGTLFGIVLLGAALRLMVVEGFELDLSTKRYRKIYWILGLCIGSWKPLPNVEYVSVFKTVKNSRARVIAAEANLGFEVYKVNLFYKGNKHIEVFMADESEEAFKVAKHIASELKIPTLDATLQEKKWI